MRRTEIDLLLGSQIHGGKQVPTDLSAIHLVSSVRQCWIILSLEIETSMVQTAHSSNGAPCWAGGDPAVLVGLVHLSVGHCCQEVITSQFCKLVLSTCVFLLVCREKYPDLSFFFLSVVLSMCVSV